MTTQITSQLTAYKSTLGCQPEQGPTAMDLAINFADDTVFVKEFFQEESKLEIDFIQSVFVDNSASVTDVTISALNTVFNLKIKAGAQGFYPLSLPAGKPVLTFSRDAEEDTTLNLVFFNTIVPFVNWLT